MARESRFRFPYDVTMQADDTGVAAPIGGEPRGWCDIVGRGRLGQALSAALRAAGVPVRGPLGRGADAAGASIALLCVPDRTIGEAARCITPGVLVGHTSASVALAPLEPHERFSMHPLLSVIGTDTAFAGATCAIDGSTPRAMETARGLALRLGMLPRVIPREQRALYHAAASMAANYLVTLEASAERLAQLVGLDRAALEPLVRGAVTQWAMVGGHDALTGPVARGDVETVARQRAAVADAAPDMLPFWDSLVEATRALAATPQVAR